MKKFTLFLDYLNGTVPVRRETLIILTVIIIAPLLPISTLAYRWLTMPDGTTPIRIHDDTEMVCSKKAVANDIARRDAALLAAMFLAEHSHLADYASRNEPSIRVCIWMAQGFDHSSEVKRVEQCSLNEADVTFPITYDSLNYARLEAPSVTHIPEINQGLLKAM